MFKLGYFVLGILATLSIGFLTAPFWYWLTPPEREVFETIKSQKGNIVIVIGYDEAQEPIIRATGRNSSDPRAAASNGYWHENWLVTYKDLDKAIEKRDKLLEIIQND